MLRKIYKKIACQKIQSETDSTAPEAENIPADLNVLSDKLRKTFEQCDDFIMREVKVYKGRIHVLIAFIDGLVKKELIDRDILKPLLADIKVTGLEERLGSKPVLKVLSDDLLTSSSIETTDDYTTVVDSILSGQTAVFATGAAVALLADTTGFKSRSVDKTDTETVVRGPREGFTEVLKTNVSLLRRKIKNPNLKFETIQLGKRTKTDISLCYIKGLTNESIIKEARKRLNSIKIDAVLESGYLEEYIEDAKYSLFPTVGNTEKPDVAAAKVLEGRLAILCDGTPFVLTVPYLFIEMIQASEDYYTRPFFASFLRILRALSLVISTIVPAIYVALICFHQDMIPMELAVRIAASREGIPFSAFVEALAMVVTFELLREAGARMPRTIGQAVNIVGALVIGQAAVDAGLVSDIMVIVIAITAISSFIVVPMSSTTFFVRIMLLISANVLGLLGVGLALTALFAHACSLQSFGVPYMSPISPLFVSDLKDTLIRVPIWAMLKRPRALNSPDIYRNEKNTTPKSGESR